MQVKKVPVTEALGHILLHHQIDAHGQKILSKGRYITREEIPALEMSGCQEVYVAILDEEDVSENEAAHYLGEMLAGDRLETSRAATGHVNLVATAPGLLKVDQEALLALNSQPGITLATIRTHTVVRPKTITGTIKIIPYAVPRSDLEAAATIAQDNPPLTVKPFVVKRATLIISGSQANEQKVTAGFTAPLRERLAAYGAELKLGPYAPPQETALSHALKLALDEKTEMILVAGETSIVDINDIIPRAIKAIGGEIIQYGMPVKPGNLLLMAYYHGIPVVGVPGCARSKKYNVVDMVLPRLAAGEQLTQRDLLEMGHGGLI